MLYCIHTYDGKCKCVIIVRSCMSMINDSNIGLLLDMFYYQCLIITIRYPITINITVWSLDIDGSLGILRWIMPIIWTYWWLNFVHEVRIVLLFILFSIQLLLFQCLLIWFWFLKQQILKIRKRTWKLFLTT